MASHLQFRSAEVPIHDHQHQVSSTGPASGLLFPLMAIAPTLENSWCVHQLEAPLQSLEAEPVGLGFGGGAHGRTHVPNDLVEQRTDQGGLAAGSGAKDHQGQVAALQLLGHPLSLLSKSFSAHGIVELVEKAIDTFQTLFGGLTTGVGR